MIPDSLSSAISVSGARFPDRPALRAGSEHQTYGELERGIAIAAARLAELQVRGERVGLLLPNLPSFPVVFYGLLRAGASVLLLNPRNSPREIREAVLDSGTRTVLTSAPLATLLPMGIRVIAIEELSTLPGGRASTVAKPADPELPTDPVEQEDAEAVVVYTSATAGWARGARLSHGNLVANARATVEAMQLGPEDRVIAALPLIHLFGLTVTLTAPLLAGATVLLLERFRPGTLLELLEREQATVICGVPALYVALLAAAARRGLPAHALRLAICGGAPVPSGLTREWEAAFGMPLREGYGLTEAGLVCLFDRVDQPPHPGTLGSPLPGVEASIRDEAGHELPAGEVGEICVRGPNVFLGYVGEKRRHPRDFHGDWLRTGDLGSVEPGGVIRFRGYLKSMFTRNGFNIYPREIERALEEDPRIGGAGVFARPDPARENEIILYVQPAAGEPLSEEQVREICVERLAAYKQPGEIRLETGVSGMEGHRV